MKALLENIRKLLKDRRFRQLWYRSVSAFAALVVFITTYALVLPAITIEKTAACGIEEHQHDESCYESRLVCGQEESEGHHHDDSCCSITKELVCDLEEHEHSEENGCYDEEGNLICETPGHTHSASCFKESKTLTCGQEEREGHHHTDACYEKVLVCGKESHIHSAECYKEDSSAVAATDEAAGGASTVISGGSDPAGSDAMPGEYAEGGTSGMTDTTEEPAVSDPSVPQLDPVDMDDMMTKDTGFYYFHAEEGEDIPANSAEITDWQKVKKDTELGSTDLVKAYFAYKIPAGSLNESNPVARYRIPGSIHLTDDQIEAINLTENGVYTSLNSEEEARIYLGAEAIEGSRKPDEELVDGVQEYISAIVRAENIFDEEGRYLGQDLIFTFVPYTIEKNQNTYDADGSQLTAGEKITGWFACDFNMNQIDWVEEETDLDNSTAEKSAEVVFVEEDREIGRKEISTVLSLVETSDTADNSETASTASSEETAEAAAAEADSSEEKSAEDASSADETVSDTELTKTPEYKSGTLTTDGDGYKITLDYTEEAKIPENAELSVKEITPETDKGAYEACLEQAQKQVAGGDKSTVDQVASRFFDIEIVVRSTGDGDDEGDSLRKIEPAAPVSVNIQITDTNTNAETASESGKAEQNDPTVLHFAEEGVEQIDSTVKDSKEQKNGEGQSTEVQFEAESFSVYGVVYTVDFEYSVNGKVYQFSLPGGGFVSFTDLIEVLGITGDKKNGNNSNENREEIAGNADENTVNEGTEESGINSAANEALTLADIVVSDAAREFAANVADMEFSNPGLVDVSRVGAYTTVGQIKESRGLNIQYSAELTEEQIAGINAQTVEAGDWALISVQPFTSEETLTVTMKDGELFTIRVTDAQISKDFITAKGDTYTITVIYDEDAKIPDDADLKAREIVKGTDEYQGYLNNTVKELDLENTDEVSFARFFDVEIVDSDNNKIEPKTPVQVKIAYKDSLNVGLGDNVQIVHFAEQGVEVISDITLTKERKEITYNQGSFSVTGTVVTNPTTGTEDNPKQYALVVKYDGNYYSVNSDGTLAPVVVNDVNNPTSVVIGSPMLWTYASNGNIYHHTDAVDTGFGEVASDFYYKYVDVNSDDGIYNEEQITNFTKGQDATSHYEGYTEPSKENNDVKLVVSNKYHPTGFSQLAWTVQTHKQANRCRTNYNTGTHLLTNSDNTRVLGVVETDGALHLVSEPAGSNNGVELYFTDVHASVPEVSPYDHTVNHIDISIDSSSKVEVPLAYGTYYDASGNPILRVDRNGDYYERINEGWVIATDSDGNPINKDNQLKVEHPITIDGEDIKAGTITATDRNGNVIENAFYVSGYSANAPSGDNNWQVRIEGSFKTATTAPVNKSESTPNSQSVMADRLNHQIYYTVSTVKYNEPVDVKYGSNKIQLYDNHGNALKFSVNITIESDRFSYWDSRNDCPALALSNYQWTEHRLTNRTDWWGNPIYEDVTCYWNQGGIYTGNDPHDANWYMSGIDTDISGDKVTAKADVLALEVTKYILDENGNVLSLKPGQNLQTKYEVFEKTPDYEPDDVKDLNPGDAIRGTHSLPQTSYEDPGDSLYTGYEKSTDLTIDIDDNGKGEVHYYDVTDGLYYIKENPDFIKNTVIASDGTVYSYVETIIESEYAWRNDQYQRPTYEEAVHVSPTYTDKISDKYRSIPEAIGEYKDKDGSWEQEDGTLLRNAFLPFYVYNVYKPTVEDISVEKVWDDKGAIVDHSSTVISFTVKATIPASDGTGTEDYTVEGVTGTYELRNGAWSKSFEDAPGMTADGREITYSVEENTVLNDYNSQVTVNQTTVNGKTVIQFTITNTFSRGALKITKNVTYNKGEIGVIPVGKEPLVDKEFLFAVTKDGTPIDGSPFSITITNGASNSLTILDLETGNYVITETDSKGLELTEYSGGVSQDSTTKSVTVTVTAGDIAAAQSSAQASFTNNYSETDIIVKKVDQVKAEADPDDDERFIAGAKFSLLDSDEHAVTGYKVINLKNNQEVELEDNKFVVPVEGVKITGLPNGSYVLKECEAPVGYIITNNITAFTVADGQVTAGSDGSTFEIPNPPGAALPSTGGSGTRFFRVLGSILLLGAGALLCRRRQRLI